jgi:hypothetical protein
MSCDGKQRRAGRISDGLGSQRIVISKMAQSYYELGLATRKDA